MTEAPGKKATKPSAKARRADVLRILYANYHCAETGSCRPWRFAVERSRLRDRGATDTLLGSLLAEGLVEHRVETTRKPRGRRTFRRSPAPPFSERSCFVLTPAGVAHARELRREPARGDVLVPRWDRDSRTLYMGDEPLKRFPFSGTHTELLLEAFVDAGWTGDWIDNPLPGGEGIRRERLRAALRNLGSDLTRIKFEMDESARRVRWILC